jgi:hypothetical protein
MIGRKWPTEFRAIMWGAVSAEAAMRSRECNVIKSGDQP